MESQDDVTEGKPAKCKECYHGQICMLTPFMAIKYCGGPWKDKVAHLKYVKDVIRFVMPKKFDK